MKTPKFNDKINSMSINSNGMLENNYKKGFIGRLILVLIALFIVLSYFNINLKTVFESPTFKQNASYVLEIGKTVWYGYLEKPSQYLWNSIFAQVIKESFIETIANVKAIKEGRTGDLKTSFALPSGFIPQVGAQPQQ